MPGPGLEATTPSYPLAPAEGTVPHLSLTCPPDLRNPSSSRWPLTLSHSPCSVSDMKGVRWVTDHGRACRCDGIAGGSRGKRRTEAFPPEESSGALDIALLKEAGELSVEAVCRVVVPDGQGVPLRA